MWTSIAFLGGFCTAITVFAVGAIIAGGREDDRLDMSDDDMRAALEGDLTRYVRELNEVR